MKVVIQYFLTLNTQILTILTLYIHNASIVKIIFRIDKKYILILKIIAK